MKKQRVFRLFILLALVAGSALYIGWSKRTPGHSSRNSTSSSLHRTDETLYPESHATPLYDDITELPPLQVTTSASYKNLQVYLITGDAATDNRKYVTLQEALKKKLVRVRETSNVNELKLDNNSKEYIYINSGDIVRGGKQDRTIQYDVIIAPGKKNVDLASFCVEHDRWQQRAGESVSTFSVSDKSTPSKELKIAAKREKSQTMMWDKVGKYQDKANNSLRKAYKDENLDVKSAASASSLELTLDNEQIKQTTAQYSKELRAKLQNRQNAIGFAYFINGKLYSVDIFNNHQLFNDLFDKLLDAAIAEAISEDSAGTYAQAEPAQVQKVLKAAAKVYEEVEVNEITRFNASEAASEKDLVIFTTTDKQVKQWLHRNWLDKTES